MRIVHHKSQLQGTTGTLIMGMTCVLFIDAWIVIFFRLLLQHACHLTTFLFTWICVPDEASFVLRPWLILCIACTMSLLLWTNADHHHVVSSAVKTSSSVDRHWGDDYSLRGWRGSLRTFPFFTFILQYARVCVASIEIISSSTTKFVTIVLYW